MTTDLPHLIALRNELNAKDGALNTLQTEKDKAVDDLKKRNNELKTQQGKTKGEVLGEACRLLFLCNRYSCMKKYLPPY